MFDGSATAEVVDLEAIYSNLSEPAAESGAALREFDFLLRAPDSDRVGPNDAPAPYSHGEELATQPHLERYDDEALNDRLTTVQDGDL